MTARSRHADQAITLLDDGITLYDKSFTHNRQAYVTHLTDALSRPGKQRDPDAAASRGAEAIQITESLNLTYSTDLLRNLYYHTSRDRQHVIGVEIAYI